MSAEPPPIAVACRHTAWAPIPISSGDSTSKLAWWKPGFASFRQRQNVVIAAAGQMQKGNDSRDLIAGSHAEQFTVEAHHLLKPRREQQNVPQPRRAYRVA